MATKKTFYMPCRITLQNVLSFVGLSNVFRYMIPPTLCCSIYLHKCDRYVTPVLLFSVLWVTNSSSPLVTQKCQVCPTLRTNVLFVQIFLLNILMDYTLRLWYPQLHSVKPHHYCLKSPLDPLEDCSYSLLLKFLEHFKEIRLRKFNTNRSYWEKDGVRESWIERNSEQIA